MAGGFHELEVYFAPVALSFAQKLDVHAHTITWNDFRV